MRKTELPIIFMMDKFVIAIMGSCSIIILGRGVRMKLIILSDLHFKEDNDWKYIDKITSNMMRRVCNKLQTDEKVIFIILGDIINSDKNNNNINVPNKYCEAEKFIELLRQKYANTNFLFVPGNHDIFNKDIVEFNNFIDRYSYKRECIFTANNSIFNLIEENINIILVDSNLSRNYNDNGKINEDLLKSKLEKKYKNLVFMHHPPYSQQTISGKSDKSIENSSDLIATHCNFVFYGHQHGDHKILDFFEKDTDIHALGSFLVKDSGVRNDFIMLDIKDGQINGAYRYDYSVEFVRELLFPKKIELKSHYVRLDKPQKNMDIEKPITRYYKTNKMDKKQDIHFLINNNNFIMISGIAGVGKSYELRNIYWQIENDEEYFPIWLNLKNANYDLAKKCVEYTTNNTIDNKDVILIIDGLSEVSGKMFENLFKDISSVGIGRSDIKIIISKRDNLSSVPEGFELYNMMPLEENDIISYAKQNKIDDIDNFIDCLRKTQCDEIAKTAFYLIEIVELYKQTKSLPVVDELMNQIIRRRLIDSDTKLSREFEHSLMSNEYILRYSFEELAFMMQALQKYSLDNMYYTKTFDLAIRGLHKDAGFIKQDELNCSCEFEHDIFREYFIAKYICNLPFDQLMSILSCEHQTNILRSTWLNVTAFILIMRSNSDLQNWLLDNNANIFYQLESNRISLNIKDEMATSILNDCFKKNLPIHTVYRDVEKFTRYFQSEAVLNFLINELTKNPNEYAVSSIVQTLQYITILNGKENIVYNLLINILQSDYPEYIFDFTMKALANVMINNINKLVDDLMPLMQDKNNMGTIKTFFEILAKAQNVENYIEFVIDKYEKADRSVINIGFNESFFAVMNSLKEADSILRCIEYMCRSNALSRVYHFNNFFETMVNKASDLYKNKEELLFGRMYEIFLFASRKCHKKKAEIIKKFFVETETINRTLEKIINNVKSDSYEKHFDLEDIMDSNLTSQLAKHYINGNVDEDLYIWYARRQPIDSKDWSILNDAYNNKVGTFIERKAPVEWEIKQLEGQQRYFDSLFNQKDFSNLVHQLITLLDKDIVIDTYFDEYFSRISFDREDLQLVGTTIYHYTSKKEMVISQFMKNINWEEFQLIKILELVESSTSLEITDEQKHFIQIYFDKTVKTIEFDKLSESNTKDNSEFWHAKNIVMLVRQLNFVCPDETLIQMLMLPWYIFSSSTSTGESPTLQFITEHISDKELLRQRIIFNIKNAELSVLAAQTHILYCLDNDISDAVDVSVKLFQNTNEDAKSRKNTAVNYLIKYKGEQFVDHLVTDTRDIELLEYLASTLKLNNQNLIITMLKANSESKDKMLFVPNLIKLNNSEGLQIYLDFIIKHNAIPEFTDGRDNSYTKVTMSIREIRDISLLKQVKQLVLLAYAKDFKDIETWGLKGNLYHAVSNLVQEDKERVAEMLKIIICENLLNEKLIFNCNYHLKQIEELKSIAEEKPWTFEQAFDYIQKRRC